MASQDQWRFCSKCFVLFFDGSANKGSCPRDGGGHNAFGLMFDLPFGQPESATSQHWRFCQDCFCMFFDGHPVSSGVCPTGGGHVAQGFVFALPHGVPVELFSQDQWRYCQQCFSMFYDGNPDFAGACPGAEGGHVAQGFMFVLPILATKPSRLQFRLRYFHEHKSTDDFLQGANDEVFIQGVGTDSGIIRKGSGNSLDIPTLRTPFVGDASADNVRNGWRAAPHVLLEFDLLQPANWPRSFTATIYMVEEDNEGLLEAFAEFEAGVSDKIRAEITNAAITAGALAGAGFGNILPGLGPLAGAAIGALGAAAYQEILEVIKDGLGNEAFTPVSRTILINDPTLIRLNPEIGREETIRVTEKGADYEIFYDWHLV